MSLLEVDNLQSGYLGQLVVVGATLHVDKGEVVALIGPNGAGKSTLLNTIIGLVRPVAGTVIFDGANITGIATEATASLGIGYVPQVRNIFPSLTVLETLQVCCRRRDFKVALDEVLDDFPQLRRRLRVRSGLLSGGERQMLALSTALINRPLRLVLMDEPSAGVSVDNVRAIFDRIRTIQLAGATILMVEQNAVRSLEMCDRAYVLEAGRVALEGSGQDIRNSPELRQIFVGVKASERSKSVPTAPGEG
jgi:ABC-type branched-subunit amino acid transport system ATPase component